MPQFLWCVCPVHLCPHRSCPQYHQGSIGQGQHPQGKGQLWEVEDIILLLEFCLKNTYFSFQGQFYEQVEGAAMGSPVSPIVANLYMEYLEQKSSKHCTQPPKFGGRYVDDTFVIHKEANKQSFLQHINSVDPAIRFTVEDNKEDGSIPFLDTIVKPEADGSLSITVYRKPTHTDQYLQWDSHHHLSAKFSVIQTLSHRASHHVQQSWVAPKGETTPQEYKEYLKAPSAIHHHSTLTGHTTNQNNFQIIGRGAQFS